VKDTFSNGASKTNESNLHHEGEFNVIVQKNERITADDHFQDVRHVELKIQNDNNEALYSPGDVAVIRPKNLPIEVDAFLEYMNWSDLADEQIIVRPTSEGKLATTVVVPTALANICVIRSSRSIALATSFDV
jgi:sulfite reductase alpha subunit-like flavoprotein